MSNAEKIASLKPAGRVVLSSERGISVVAERSGVGGILRIVRVTRDSFRVLEQSKRWPS